MNCKEKKKAISFYKTFAYVEGFTNKFNINIHNIFFVICVKNFGFNFHGKPSVGIFLSWALIVTDKIHLLRHFRTFSIKV